MDAKDRQHLTELRETLTRRFHVLEQQAAEQGGQTPPHVLIEIEDLRKKIAEIDQQLGVLEASKGEQLATLLPCPYPGMQPFTDRYAEYFFRHEITALRGETLAEAIELPALKYGVKVNPKLINRLAPRAGLRRRARHNRRTGNAGVIRRSDG